MSSTPPARGRSALLALAAGVLAFWLVAAVLAGEGAVKSFDLVNYYLPVYQVTFDELASGSLPLWNPYHLTGVPWLATLQAGAFYPPRWLYAFLPPNHALAASHALHLVLIAVSMAAFGRKLGLGWPAAAIAAIPFALRGTTWWWLQFPSVLDAGAWLPLGAVAVLGIADGEGRRSAACLALALGMSLLAGYTQATVFCVTAWSTLLVAVLIARRMGARQSCTMLGIFVAAIAIGALIGAVQVLPTFELTLEGTRTTETLTRAQAQTVGGKASYLIGLALVGSHVSLGATLLVLAPVGLLSRRHRAVAIWALLLGGVAYVLAVGTSTSLVEAYRALPVIGWFRNPRRLLFLANFALAVLAAIGADELLRREPGWRRGGIVASLCALALAVWAATRGEAAMAACALGFAGICSASLLPRPQLPAALLAGGLLALAVTDAALERSDLGRLPYDRASAATYTENAALFRQLAGEQGDSRGVWIGPRRDRELKLAARYRTRWLDDYEPLNLRRHSEYFTYLQHGTTRLWNERGSFAGVILPQTFRPQTVPHWVQIAERRRLLDLASASHFVIARQLVAREAARAFIAEAGLGPGYAAGKGWAVFENPHALPRAFVTYRAEPAPSSGDLLRRLADPSFDPMQVSLVEGGGDLPGSNRRGHPAKIVRDEHEQVEVEAVLAEPGLLVLGDAYMRGWRASSDGAPLDILPTNHLFRGVLLPAGKHRVRFEYRPASVAAGAFLALAGLVALALLARRQPPARRA